MHERYESHIHLVSSFGLQFPPIRLPDTGTLIDFATHVCHGLSQAIQVCHRVQGSRILQLQGMLDAPLLCTAREVALQRRFTLVETGLMVM